jgi:thiamine monophosphate synthase
VHFRKKLKIPGGIYPILNVSPGVDTDELLDWAVRLPDAGVRIVQVRVKGIPDESLLPVLDDLTGMLRG